MGTPALGKKEVWGKEHTSFHTRLSNQEPFLLSWSWVWSLAVPAAPEEAGAGEADGGRWRPMGPRAVSRTPPRSSPAHTGHVLLCADHAWPHRTSFCPGWRTPATGGATGTSPFATGLLRNVAQPDSNAPYVSSRNVLRRVSGRVLLRNVNSHRRRVRVNQKPSVEAVAPASGA